MGVRARRSLRLNSFALTVAMIGVGIISLDSAGEPEMAGVLLALLSGVLFAVYMINLQRTKDVQPVYLTWVNNLVCALLLLMVVRSQLALPLDQALVLAVMGAVQLGMPYFLFSKGLATVSLQEASLIALVEPVLNPLWVALVVGEIPSAATVGRRRVDSIWPRSALCLADVGQVRGSRAKGIANVSRPSLSRNCANLPGWRMWSIPLRVPEF